MDKMLNGPKFLVISVLGRITLMFSVCEVLTFHFKVKLKEKYHLNKDENMCFGPEKHLMLTQRNHQ